MKNKTQVMSQHSDIRIPDWLFLETQEEDFLMGKSPLDLQEIVEDDG